jgi:hypothetical protein
MWERSSITALAMSEPLQAPEVSDQAKEWLLGKTSQDISLGAVTSTNF